MIGVYATKATQKTFTHNVECTIKGEPHEVFIFPLTEDEVKSWGFPAILRRSLPTIESLILPEIARIEQQLKKGLRLIWESALSPEDKREMGTAADHILRESHDIAETVKMLCELGE